MAEKLLTLGNDQRLKSSEKLLSSLKFKEILEDLLDQIVKGTDKAVIVLKNIFEGENGESIQKRVETIKKIFVILNEEVVTTKVTSDIIGFILLELENVPVKALVELMDFVLGKIDSSFITNPKSLELFPKILSVLTTFNDIPVKEDETTMSLTATEYKRHIIHQLCKFRWKSSIVTFIAIMLRDIQLTDDELATSLKKILKVFHELPLQEVPSLIYQSLLLSSKGCKNIVLDGILTFFWMKSKDLQLNSDSASFLQDTSDLFNLRSVEGTVLLHIIFAMKQDQEFGKEFLKYLKNDYATSPEKILSPFTIALTLSMTQIHRLEEQIYDFFKLFLRQTFRDEELQKKSKWIRNLFPKVIHFEDVFLSTSQNTKFGWDNMTQGLINLAFLLFNSYTPKSSDNFSIMSDPRTTQQRTCKLGANIIQQVFRNQEIARKDILKKLLDGIVSKAAGDVQHYLDLLTNAIASVPQIVLDCINMFREVFDYLSLLNVPTVEGLLRAVLPLMKVSMSIKDSLILILRKSMFSKQPHARKIAVTGFMLILKHFKINCNGVGYSLNSQLAYSQSYSCSQVNISSQGRYNVEANESLCLEIIGYLRKSLTQRGDVRKQLYEGIYEVSCKNPQLSYSVLDLLYQQFLLYYKEGEDVTPPINLEDCVKRMACEIHVSDPMDYLLSALQSCVNKSGKRLENDEEEDENLSNLLDRVEDMLMSVSKRLIKTDLEDFGLDKTADYGSSSDVGVKNSTLAHMLMGVYEVLIEYNYMKSETISVENMETVWQLFEKSMKLQEVMKENNKGKRSKTTSTKTCMISFKCLTAMITGILSNTEETAEPGFNVLRQSVELIKFLTISVNLKLEQVIDHRRCDGAGGNNLDHVFRKSLLLSRAFLQHINGDCVLADDILKRDKGKKLSNYCLDGLSLIMGFVCTHTPDKMKVLLEKLDFSPDVISQNDIEAGGSLLFRIIRRIQRLSIKIITSPDEDLGLKEAQVVLAMLSYLVPHLDQETELLQVYTWFHRLASEHNMDDVALTKLIFTKLLALHHQCKTSNSTITKIAQDIHSQIGDIDEDIEVENRSHFSSITEKTAAPTVMIVLLHHIEEILDEVDWALTKLKLIPVQSKDEEADGEMDEREKIQTQISQLLLSVVLSLHELVQSSFPIGLTADTLTKVVTKLYVTLGNFTKYFLSLYTQKHGYVIPKFERLVKLTGSHLAQQVYAMITFIQSIQSQTLHEQTVNGRQKLKDKKKGNMAGKNRALKESRSIPNLIYSIEQFERYLIQLSKKAKIDFMENMKRSTSRDFRINTASLEAALNELSDEENNEEDAENISTNSSRAATHEVLDLTKDAVDQPPKKKSKLSAKKNPLGGSNL